MFEKTIKRDHYFAKGREARNNYLPRNGNPYTLKSDKGQLWDDGWLSLGNRTVPYRSGNGKLKELTLPKDAKDDHSNDDLRVPPTY